MTRWLLCAMLMLCGVVHADETPPQVQVRVHQEPAGPLLQGQTARVVVDVLTPDFFIDAPVLPQLHVEGMYLSLSDETPGHLVETIDGVTWSGVSRTYLVTPLVSGRVDIPAFDITTHVGAKATPVIVTTTPLHLQMQPLVLPEGVTEALIANSVKITQTVMPEHGGLHVGDSVIRRVEITAEGSAAMMLPPTTFQPVSGLGLYASPPVTRDVAGSKGGFVGGSRVDVGTYVIQRRGRYTLPPISVRWMDPQSRQWRTSSVPEVRFHAWWGAPAKPRFALPGQGVVPRVVGFLSSDLGILLVLLVVLGAAAWYFRDRLKRWLAAYANWRYQRKHAERVAFAALKRQRHGASATSLHMAVDAWVRRCAKDGGPSTMDGWCAAYGDAPLRQQWSALQGALYGTSSTAWSATQLVDGIAAARRRWQRSRRRSFRKVMLPPLNPA